MEKKYQTIFPIILLFHNIIFSSSLVNNINNSIIIEISPTWKINPYDKYSIYTGSLMLNSPKWVFFVKPVVTNKEVGKQILGTEFDRFGINGRITNAYIKYDSGKSSFLWGRAHVHWGQSHSSSIIQSNFVPTYDHGLFEIKISNYKVELLFGQLGSEMLDDKRITRFISGHRLTGKYFNNKLEIQMGEQIIYTGYNRNIELSYLNPIIPYFFSISDGEDLNENGINYDNTMIFISGRYFPKNNYSLFWEFILDDYQYENTSTQNMLGWKFGIEGETTMFNYPINWGIEYTQIDSWTYLHNGQSFTGWQNRGHAIGYPYGSDLRSFYIQADTWLKKETIKFDIEYMWLGKGANNFITARNRKNEGTLDDPFPSEPVNIFNLFEASILYQNTYISVKTGYTNKPFPYEIANGLIEKLQGGAFISLGLHLNIDKKIMNN